MIVFYAGVHRPLDIRMIKVVVPIPLLGTFFDAYQSKGGELILKKTMQLVKGK